MENAGAAVATVPATAPEKPPAGVAVFLWAGIIFAAGGSLTFNIWHDYHAIKLHIVLAVIAGSIPPSLSAVLAHAAVTLRCGKTGKAVVFAITGGAMVVSAFASSQVLKPGYGIGMGVVYSVVMDSAAMTCLYFLFTVYEAKAAYRMWLAGQDAGTGAAGGNQPGGTGTGNQPGGAAGSAAAAVPGTTVVPGDPVPAAGSGNHDGPLGGELGAAPSSPARAVAAPPRPATAPRVPRSRPAPAEGTGEPRQAVVDEIAGRERPALESTAQREKRALDILREFRKRTGLRMTNGELARALGMRKADVGSIRSAVQDREEAAA